MMAVSQRALLCVLSFMGFAIVYMLRVNLSVALVAMAGQFSWDEQTQGLILGSFFWGYIVTQIPGGLLAERFGAKWVLGIGILWTAALTLLTPLAAHWGVAALICLRVLEGVGEGVTFPSLNAMLSQWAPPVERTTMAVFIISGSHMGTVIGLPLSGYLCSTDFLGGWPAVFYTFGASGIAWFIAWSILAHSSPAANPWISREELTYIQESLKHQVLRGFAAVPLKAMLTSGPVLSMIGMHMAYNWQFYTLLTCLPTFFADVLSIPLTEDGLVSALPYLVLWATSNLTALLADAARSRGWLGVTAIRKLSIALGAVGGAAGIALVGHLGCRRGPAIAVLTAAVGLSGFIVSGFGPNQLDLAPRFAGTLHGLSNTLATVPGMVAPVIVGGFTNHASVRSNWLKVFYLSAGIVLAGCLGYLAFGSAQVQPWASATAAEEQQRLLDGEEEWTDDDGGEDAFFIARAWCRRCRAAAANDAAFSVEAAFADADEAASFGFRSACGSSAPRVAEPLNRRRLLRRTAVSLSETGAGAALQQRLWRCRLSTVGDSLPELPTAAATPAARAAPQRANKSAPGAARQTGVPACWQPRLFGRRRRCPAARRFRTRTAGRRGKRHLLAPLDRPDGSVEVQRGAAASRRLQRQLHVGLAVVVDVVQLLVRRELGRAANQHGDGLARLPVSDSPVAPLDLHPGTGVKQVQIAEQVQPEVGIPLSSLVQAAFLAADGIPEHQAVVGGVIVGVAAEPLDHFAPVAPQMAGAAESVGHFVTVDVQVGVNHHRVGQVVQVAQLPGRQTAGVQAGLRRPPMVQLDRSEARLARRNGVGLGTGVGKRQLH
uniref:Sialin n=1 Tax=Macrostomum lignano TaxID=282301 RepID=A0A1I8IM27_9PLAT